ncbi:MAG: DUF933 domain-containing protein [Planctomycetales bacterium]|nr:DUF933 domain-containing protein [Planctomycetales bacterium]
MEAAFLGFSGSGVSAVFDAVTGPGQAAVGLSGGRGRLATVPVPDPRVERLSAICKPKKTTFAGVRLRDIPGLPRGEAAGRGTLLASAREANLLVLVTGAFTSDDPRASLESDRKALDAEIHLADLALLEAWLAKRRIAGTKPTPTRDQDAAEAKELEKVVAAVADGRKPLEVAAPPALAKKVAEQPLLTAKPVLRVENVAEDAIGKLPPAPPGTFRTAARFEREAAELAPAERDEMLAAYGLREPLGPALLRAVYEALGLLSFFTIGSDEVKAWTLQKGDTAVKAAGTIHTDFAKAFVRARVCRYEDVDAAGSQDAVRVAGKIRTEGRDYVVKDGDVIEILASV